VHIDIVLRYQQSWLLPSKHCDRDEICHSKLVDGISQALRVSLKALKASEYQKETQAGRSKLRRRSYIQCFVNSDCCTMTGNAYIQKAAA